METRNVVATLGIVLAGTAMLFKRKRRIVFEIESTAGKPALQVHAGDTLVWFTKDPKTTITLTFDTDIFEPDQPGTSGSKTRTGLGHVSLKVKANMIDTPMSRYDVDIKGDPAVRPHSCPWCGTVSVVTKDGPPSKTGKRRHENGHKRATAD